MFKRPFWEEEILPIIQEETIEFPKKRLKGPEPKRVNNKKQTTLFSFMNKEKKE